MSCQPDPAGPQDRPDPDQQQAGPAEEVYSADEADQIAARLQALGYLD